MTKKSRPGIAPWMIVVGLIVAGLVFWNGQVQDQQTRNHYACINGDLSRCEPLP